MALFGPLRIKDNTSDNSAFSPNVRSLKMYRTISLSLIFLFLLILSYSFSIGTVDFRSYFSPATSISLLRREARPLRVYMYDLPRRFNVGMLDRRSAEEAPVTARTWPPWPRNSGLKRQHSVEYWMTGSLLYEGEDGHGGEREVVRVLDPELAEAFYVPFFSSLSFNTHGHNMTDPKTRFDRQLQIDLLSILEESIHWQRHGGRDHVIPMTHPNAFRFYRAELNSTIQIVVDFGRYPKSVSNLSKDVVSPYVHVVDSFVNDDVSDPYESRTTLLFFRGKTFRKDEGIVRVKLAKVLDGYDDVHYERSVATGENIKTSSRGMRSSKFCLHPAGDTPSSCRLFDAIASHCVPVIVSDQIELPFEDEIDYSQFSIFFSFKEALEPGLMVDRLRNIPKDKWLEMWARLKSVSHHFEFQYPPLKEDAVDMLWRQVRHKLPGIKLDIHRKRRLKIPDWWS